jgi:zinc protease
MSILRVWICAIIITWAQTTTANNIKTEKWLTENGMQVIFYRAMEVPMLDINLAFAAGSAYDGDHYGLSSLTSRMMDQGSAGQNATTIAQSLADVGAQYKVELNKDMVVFSLRTLVTADALSQSSKVFAQIINHPDFPDSVFSQEKKQQLMTIEQQQESPEETAQLQFFQSLYQNHPYAHSVNGSNETVNTISKSQVIAFQKRYYVAKNGILVIVGAIDSNTAHQLAKQISKDLSEGQRASALPKATPLTKAQTVNLPFPSSQTMIRLGQIGIDHHDPDYFPLIVGNYILGGGILVSRLIIEVREKQGLTYGIDSQFVPMEGKGPFLISLSTKNQQTPKALEIIQQVLREYINQGPSEDELKAAKQYLMGSFPLSLSGNQNIANLLMRIAFYHLPDDFLEQYTARINAVTTEQIKRAFTSHINPNQLLLVTVGKS